MVKRKCGTCRHFKDGGIAGSGWCQHQARKDIQHMVLVRKTELACRNSWDQDLWELADQPIDLQHSTNIPMPLSGGDAQDITILHAEQPSDDAGRAGEMFTDRITSISMPTRSQLRPGRTEGEQALDDAEMIDQMGARSSVREARRRRQEQRHLERKKHQETVLQRVDDLLDTSEPAEEIDRGLMRVRSTDGPMTSSHSGSRESTDRPVRDRAQQDVTGSGRVERGKPSAPAIEFGAKDPNFRGEPRKVEPPSEPRSTPNAHASNHNGNGTHAERLGGGTEPLPSAAEVRAAVSKERGQPVKARRSSELERSSGVSRTEFANAQRDRLPKAAPDDLPPAVEERYPKWVTGAGNIQQLGTTTEAAAPFPVDPIDLVRDLQTVRRCCATCRDFKQIGDGRTGWCNNPYAFSERRMVQSNEIACRSSLGIWWLPHDDLWLEHADTTHHGRPTPLLDEMVGSAPAHRQGMEQRSS